MATTLPRWMRNALFATAVMNLLAGIGFLPFAGAVRSATGMPAGEHGVYLTTVALFVELFGIGYLWVAIANRAERLFIALAAAGKIGFFTIILGYWLAGVLPAAAPVAGSADLVFGALFVAWLASAE